MEVAPAPTPITTFDALPDPLISCVFSFLDKREIGSVRAVCLKWALKVQQTHGVQLVINNYNNRYLLYFPKYGSEVKFVKLMNLTFPIPTPTPITRFVTTLEVAEKMCPHVVLNFVKNCHLLEHLTFSGVMFKDHDADDLTVNVLTFKPSAKLKSIAIRTVSNANFKQNERFIFELLHGFNLIHLNSFAFKRRYSNIISKNDFNISGKKELMDTNKRKWLLRDDESTLLKKVAEIVLKTKASLKKLHLENIAEFEYHQNLIRALPKLHELNGTITRNYGWTCLLAAQSTLTVLRLEIFWGIWDEIKSCIVSCANTLKELKLIGFRGVEYCCQSCPINLNFLCIATRLKKFHIECPRFRKTAQQLPTSLESLYLDGPISREDLISIFNSFFNLKYFCLKNYGFNLLEVDLLGHIETEVFDLAIFELIIQSPKIKKIVLQHCMMMRTEIVQFCRSKGGIEVKSQNATVNSQTVGYFYNMEIDVRSRKRN